MERVGCLGNCPGYELEIHSDGTIIWNGHYEVALKGRARATANAQIVNNAFQQLFPTSEREICISEGGVDSPVHYILFSKIGSRTQLKLRREEARKEYYTTHYAENPASTEPCSIQETFDAAIELLERAANSHRWMHGKESIQDERKVTADVYMGTKPAFTPLMRAAGKGEIPAVRELLKEIAVDGRDESGWTALMVAAVLCQPGVVSELLGAGANPNGQDDNGDSPLIAAVTGNCFSSRVDPAQLRSQLATQMVNAGADVNRPNKFGQTPLMAAARFANPEAVGVLLGLGANLTARDRSGLNAAAYANKYRRRVKMEYNSDHWEEYERKFREVSALLSNVALRRK